MRHGETEWSALGRHTSITDLDLTETGLDQAKALAPLFAEREFAAVMCSPRIRALHTAELAGLTVTALDVDLVEWDYGRYEGLTTDEIRHDVPHWTLWRDGCPGGERAWQVGARVDRVLNYARRLVGSGDVALVGHAHVLRVAAARWVDLPASCGEALRLEPATVSELGYEHEHPAILTWNVPPSRLTEPAGTPGSRPWPLQ